MRPKASGVASMWPTSLDITSRRMRARAAELYVRLMRGEVVTGLNDEKQEHMGLLEENIQGEQIIRL
ncbi:MAG: hypothetical protein J2P21_31615 [Chloracidobacterium sp.]|nr:hypothetical protein [Chloracidobacterium sp.]